MEGNDMADGNDARINDDSKINDGGAPTALETKGGAGVREGHVDYELAKERGIDINNPRIGLKIASERLAIVRYVFLVQVEDGIATADQRSCLEYADAVLIGWPDMDADGIADLDESGRQTVEERLRSMEGYIARFSAKEAEGDVDTMTDLLVRATECVASIRRLYQPDFPIPTYAEIRHVVQDEWDDDMDKIDLKEHDTTVEAIEEETEKADEQRDADETDSSNTGSDGHKSDGQAGADAAQNAEHGDK